MTKTANAINREILDAISNLIQYIKEHKDRCVLVDLITDANEIVMHACVNPDEVELGCVVRLGNVQIPFSGLCYDNTHWDAIIKDDMILISHPTLKDFAIKIH